MSDVVYREDIVEAMRRDLLNPSLPSDLTYALGRRSFTMEQVIDEVDRRTEVGVRFYQLFEEDYLERQARDKT